MQIRTDGGWLRAGLAVLVTGILGGGVLAVVGGPNEAGQVTADGMATGQPAAATPREPAPPKEAAAGQEDPAVGDKVLMGDDGGSVTVSAVEDNVSAGRLFGAGEGSKYVAAEVKGCSGPHEKNITFEPSWFLLRLADGTIRDAGLGAKKPSLEGGTIPPGKCLSGWITFTVPDGAVPTGVIYDGSTRTTWTVPPPKTANPTTTTTTTAATKAPASSSTTTTSKPKASSSTTSTSTSKATGSTTTTTSKAKASTSTTTTTNRGAAASSTTTTTGAPSAKASTTTTTKPEMSSTTTTTASEG